MICRSLSRPTNLFGVDDRRNRPLASCNNVNAGDLTHSGVFKSRVGVVASVLLLARAFIKWQFELLVSNAAKATLLALDDGVLGDSNGLTLYLTGAKSSSSSSSTLTWLFDLVIGFGGVAFSRSNDDSVDSVYSACVLYLMQTATTYPWSF